MNRETERQYLAPNEDVDNPRRWGSEGGYFRGVGDDGLSFFDTTVTPSGDATRQTSGSTWVDAFKETLPIIAGAYQQREFNKMNMALINTGRPPISAQQYTQMQPAAARVEVGATSDTKRWIIYAGLGVLALVGLRAAKII